MGFFLLGYRDFQGRRFQEAKESLEQSNRSVTTIQDYVAFYLASVDFELKEFKECQDQLLDFSSRFPKSPLLAKARLLFWQTSIELKDGQTVLNSLKGAASLESNPDALFYRAQAHELLNEASKALPIYQRLHYEFPLYAKAAVVEQSLTTLGGADQEVPREWRIGRIAKLVGGRKHRDVLKDLQLLL